MNRILAVPALGILLISFGTCFAQNSPPAPTQQTSRPEPLLRRPGTPLHLEECSYTRLRPMPSLIVEAMRLFGGTRVRTSCTMPAPSIMARQNTAGTFARGWP